MVSRRVSIFRLCPLKAWTPMLRNLPVTCNRLSYSKKVKSWLYFLLNSKKQKYTSRYIKIVQTLLDSILALAELQTVETLIRKASQALARGVECAVCCVLCACFPTCANTNPPLFQHPSRTCWRWDWSSEWSSGVSARSRGVRTASSSASRSLQVRTSPHDWTH